MVKSINKNKIKYNIYLKKIERVFFYVKYIYIYLMENIKNDF